MKPSQNSQENVCHSTWKIYPESPEVPDQGQFTSYFFCYPVQKLIAFVSCRMCLQKQHTTELQPEKNQHSPHNVREKRAASTATSASWSDSTSTQAPLEDCHFITLQLPQTFSSVQFHTTWHYVAKPPPSAADLMWYQWPWEDLFAWQRHLAPAIWTTFLVCAGSKELMPWFEFKS